MEDTVKLYYLLKKYNAYDDVVRCKPFEYLPEEYKDGFYDGAILTDALFTAWQLPYGSHSVKTMNSDVLNDIKDILRILPSSVKCRIGNMRCRDFIPPLVIACMNEEIPFEIAEQIYKMNPATDYHLNNQKIDLLKDLNNVSTERKELIIKLLKPVPAAVPSVVEELPE